MAHPTRTEIRDDAVTRLKAASTLAGSRVYPNRLIPIQADEIPCILVYTGQSTDTPMIHNDTYHNRSIELSIQAVVSADTDKGVADSADILTDEILAALFTDSDWLNLVKRINSVTTDPSIQPEGNKHFVVTHIAIGLQAEVEYEIAVSGSFTGADVHTVPSNPQHTDEAGGKSIDLMSQFNPETE